MNNNIIVLKFGGTSVATPERIQQVADLVLKKRQTGQKVVVVVSARAKMTDALIEDARSFSYVVRDPAKISELSYQEMQELAEAGARVLHPKSVEFAKAKGTIIHAKSTFVADGEGTIIKNLEGRIKPRVVGVASEQKVVLARCRDQGHAGVLARLVDALAEANVKVKQISFSEVGDGVTSGNFIIPEKENYHIESVIPRLEASFPGTLHVSRHLGAVSLIGAGINDRYDFLRDCLRLLRQEQLGPASLHTSSFRISALVPRKRLEHAVNLLYEHFLRSEAKNDARS